MVCLAAETTWIGQKMNVIIAGAMGINKRDVKQGKVHTNIIQHKKKS